MSKSHCLLGVFVAAGVGGFLWHNSIYGWHSVSDPEDEFGLEFRYPGCNGWPEDRAHETAIQSSVTDSSITYRVSDPASCSYSVRWPKCRLAGGTLRLSYDLYTPSGEVAACICEYKSEFRFRTNPEAVHVVFDHSGG